MLCAHMTMLRGWGGGGGGGVITCCALCTHGGRAGLCARLTTLSTVFLCFFGWFRGKIFWAHSGGFRVCRYRSFGLFWEPFGLPVEIWGLGFQPTDLLVFFGIWGLGFQGKTFWAYSGGFRVWGLRVETF